MQVVPLVDEGLGNASWLLVVDEQAVVVDPWRDPRPYLDAVAERGLHLRYVAETHLHADFVSGARELQARGARLLAPKGARLAFDHVPLDDGEEVEVAGLVLRAIATPGHTPEHLSYLVCDGDRPLAVFSGGALITGGIARPDLLGDERTEPLARAAYRSLHDRLLSLPDEVAVHPTHGAGSFCSTGAGGGHTTTIGAEREDNPLAAADGQQTFVDRLLGGLGSFPPYYLQLRDVNRAGPTVHGPDAPELQPLDVAGLDRAVADGAEVVDVRAMDAYAARHLPGSLSIPYRAQFPVWLGWMVDRTRPVVFITDTTVDRDGLVWAALTVGFEQLVGHLDGGIDAWTDEGRDLAELPLLGADQVDGERQVIDVRQQSEWEAGHVPEAAHIELGDIPAQTETLSDQPLLVHCGHGERAMTAASLLRRAGHDDVVVLAGGPDDLTGASPA